MDTPQRLLERYRSAFIRADVLALVGCFAFPLQVVSAADRDASSSIVQAEEWPGSLDRLLGVYQRLEVADCVPAAVEITELMGTGAVLQVQWALQREDRQPVYDFTAVYILVLVEGRFQIVAIAHDALPRMRAALQGS